MKRRPLEKFAFLIDDVKHELDGAQLLKLNDWLAELAEKIDDKHRKAGHAGIVEHFKGKGEVYAGVSGGNLTFSVTPTTIGTVFKVAEAITGDRLDLTDYDNW